MQGGFGGVVDGAEDVRDDSCQGANLDDGAARADEEGGEGGADVHYGEEVRGERLVDFREGDGEGGDGVVWEFWTIALASTAIRI